MIVLMVLMMVVLLGFAALVVDVGYAYYAHRALQNSADAAALAGSQELPNAANAAAVARQYSSSAGNKNSRANINNVTTTVTTKCVVSLGGCVTGTSSNAVVVLEMAPTKTFFAGLLGIPAFTIKAKATAAMRGGTPKPAHVMIVFDRTGSMGTACTIGGTKLDCAKAGLNSFLGAMDPAYDAVGLVAFAPHNGNVCATPKTTNGAPSDYDAYPNNYLFVPLSNNYKTSATSPLVPSSQLVSTINCIKEGGTTVFAAAIDKARTTLAASHDPEAQDVIIFMTDGEANYGACATPNSTGVCSNNTSPYRTKPCGQAVASARAASDTGVWVFAIAYDTPGAGCLGWKSTGTGLGGASCATKAGIQFVCPESPAITADAALKGISYDPLDPTHPRFYSSPDPGSLTSLFKSVAAELTEGRLLDDDAE